MISKYNKSFNTSLLHFTTVLDFINAYYAHTCKHKICVCVCPCKRVQPEIKCYYF